MGDCPAIRTIYANFGYLSITRLKNRILPTPATLSADTIHSKVIDMKLLHVDSSILGAYSTSRLLTAETVAAWKAAHPDTTVEYLDLAVDAPGHFTADALAIKTGPQAEPTEAQQRENALSEKLVSQFLAADVVVIGAPMYNFSIPTQLKAWIDRLAQVGRTFKYTEKGPVGLAGGKTVIVASSRGGIYSTSDWPGRWSTRRAT
jgi:FMN-dependent NADH-azoreductase